ncbi:MAG TPA: IS200/IS605 family element transposase accessory protein TnpB [Thermoplasmata archaeon]|nr:IS200/IS605 family element transposase accessory protein TnpB [Thermoplasmata archaeon]
MLKQYAYKFQLRPNSHQAKQMAQFAGCNRLVWNKALGLQKERVEKKEKIYKYIELAGMLVEWKKDKQTKFLADTHSQTYQQTLKNLDRALREAFNKKSPKKFPVFKKKGLKDSFKYPQGFKVEQNNSRIFLPKIGWLRYRNSRTVEGDIKNVDVSKNCDKWYVSIQVEIEVKDRKHKSQSMIGIDVGITKLATLSNGETVEPLNSFRKYEKRLAFLQRGLSRKQKFSNNWKKHKKKISRLHFKIANARKDFLHKTTDKIGKNYAVVVMEDLKVSNMSRSASGTIENKGKNVKAKSGLNKSILDQGWFEFRRQLEYKLKWRGGHLELVDPKHTSRKCSECGHIESGNRPSQSKFECKNCGYSENADVNAAKNILAAGLAVFACGGYDIGQPMKQEPAMSRVQDSACA